MLETPDTPCIVRVLATFSMPRNAPPGYLREVAARMRQVPGQLCAWNQRLASEGSSVPLAPMVRCATWTSTIIFQHSALPNRAANASSASWCRACSPALDRNRPCGSCT